MSLEIRALYSQTHIVKKSISPPGTQSNLQYSIITQANVHIEIIGAGRVKGHACLLLLIGVRVLLLRGWGAIVGPSWRILLLRWLVIVRGQLDWVVGRGRQALLWAHARPAATGRCEFLSVSCAIAWLRPGAL